MTSFNISVAGRRIYRRREAASGRWSRPRGVSRAVPIGPRTPTKRLHLLPDGRGRVGTRYLVVQPSLKDAGSAWEPTLADERAFSATHSHDIYIGQSAGPTLSEPAATDLLGV